MTVQKRITRLQKLALAELYRLAGRSGAWVTVRAGADDNRDAKALQGLGLILVSRRHRSDGLCRIALTVEGVRFVKDEFGGADLPSIRESLGLPGRHGRSNFTTRWLERGDQ